MSGISFLEQLIPGTEANIETAKSSANIPARIGVKIVHIIVFIFADLVKAVGGVGIIRRSQIRKHPYSFSSKCFGDLRSINRIRAVQRQS